MKPRIAVLGAGAMGLAAAYQLARDGFQPVIFEADDRLGGMAASFDFGGISIERYYHYHCVTDYAVFQVLEETGLSHKMTWVETKMGYWYQNKLQAWGNPIALLNFKGLSLWAKVRYGLHIFTSTKRRDWRPLDKLEATGWLKRWVGKEAFEILWRCLFDFKFYEYSDNLSAAWIWSRIHRIGLSRYSMFKEKLGFVEGGSDTILNAMRAEIEARGGEVRLKSPVSKIIIEAGDVKGVEISGSLIPFDKVISTIPLPYVSRLIPDLPAEILGGYQSIKNIAVVCVIAKLRKPLSENFWVNTNDPDMDIPGLVEYTNLRPLDHPIVYVPFYIPGEHPKFKEPDTVFLDKVRRYFKKINPNLSDDDFIELRASRYRFAQPICEPGFPEKLPPIETPVKGLWVMDTSYYYPEDRSMTESIQLGREIAAKAAKAA